SPSPKSLKILIHSLDGAGHLNACIGLAQALASRGHQVIFAINAAFTDQLSVQFGFDTISLKLSPKAKHDLPEGAADDPVKALAEELLKSGLLSGASPLEKMRMMKNNNVFSE